MKPLEMFVIEERNEKYGVVAHGYKLDGILYLKEIVSYNNTPDPLICCAFTDKQTIMSKIITPAFDTTVFSWLEPKIIPADEKITLEIVTK